MTGIFIAIAAVVAVILISFIMFSSNYIKAEPDRALILTGRKYKLTTPDGKIITRGWRSIHGGATLRIPILEKINWMSLRNMNLPDISVHAAYSKEGVPVTIEVVANTKISSESEMLSRAIERFLGIAPDEIKRVIKETIEGQLRDIIGTMTVEELNQDRETFVARVLQQSGEELGKMGILVDVINIQKISDPNGYLDALGRKRTAEVIRDAEIGEAEAKRESTIKTETAKREAAVVKADQERQTAEAEKNRDVAKQQYQGETMAATEIAAQRGPLAKAEAEKEVVAAQQRVKESEEKARREVEAAKASADEQKYKAIVVVPADAERQRAIKIAEGEAEAVKRRAEAAAYEIEIKGRSEGEAEKAKLTGQAEGTEKMANALNVYQESGKLKITLDALVEVAKAGAVTLDNFVPEKVIAFDGGGGNGRSTLSDLAVSGPIALSRFVESVGGAMGIDLMKLVKDYTVDESQKNDQDSVSVEEIS